MSFLPDIGLVFFLGPLTTRAIRNERLLGSKSSVIEHKDLKERVVFHDYVDGRVTGSASSVPEGIHVLSTMGGSFSKRIGDHIFGYEHVMTARSSVCPITGEFLIFVQCTEVTVGIEEEPDEVVGSCVIRLERNLDAHNGSETYRNPVVTSFGGKWSNSTVAAVVCSSPYVGSSTDGPTSGAGIKSIEHFLDRALNRDSVYKGNDSYLRDEAIWNALNDFEPVNINWLSDFKDMAEPLAIAQQLAKALHISGNILDYVKTVANFHLLWSYVIKMNILTAEEVKKLVHYVSGGYNASIGRALLEDMVGRGTASQTFPIKNGSALVEHHAKVVMGSGWGPFADVAKLQLLGLIPGVVDLWDDVPYSFVVDWVMPIQDSLQKFQSMAAILQLPLKYIVVGRKVTRSISADFTTGGHNFNLQVNAVDYSRNIIHSFPLDMSFGDLSFRDPRKHGLIGASLILQRFL